MHRLTRYVLLRNNFALKSILSIGDDMFLVNIRVTKRRALFLTLILVLAATLAVCIGFMNENRPQKDEYACADGEDVAEYLKEFGIEVGEITVDEITVPHMFGEVYHSYNKLQESQGFDLSDFKGKTLTRYTAEVLNNPGFDSGVFAEILVYGKKIVGADVYSVSADGFIAALK